MAGPAASITIDDSALMDALTRVAAFPTRLTPALDEIGEAMVSSTQRRFGREEGPDGTPWLQSKRAKRDGGKTLQLTRRLFNSIVSQLLAGATGVEWGTNVVYGAIHQFGGLIYKYAKSAPIYRKVKDGEIQRGFVKKKSSNFESWHEQGNHAIIMPARPYIGIDQADQSEIAEILARHLAAAIAGAAPGEAL